MRAMIRRFRYSSISAWVSAFSAVAVDLLLIGPPLGFRATLARVRDTLNPNVRLSPWSASTAPRFGIFLSAQHPPAMAASQIARDCCEQVRLARELGFADVSAGQHFLTQPFQMLQLVPLLARIAAEAGEMRVCSGIFLLTLLNPVEVAENAATLDAITDGRFVLGLGLGYRQEENDAFGLPEKRLRVFEQKLDVVRRLLEGEAVTADGHGFRLVEQQLALRPTQVPRPPIWLAANNDKAVLRAARLADAWLLNPHTKLTSSSGNSASTTPSASAAAWRPRARSRSSRSSTSARTTSLRCGRSGRSWRTSTRPTWPGGRARCCPRATRSGRRSSSSREGGRFIVGGPETCARQVREHVARLGATSFLFRFQWPGMPQELVLASMRRAAESVFPLVAG